MLTHLEFKIFGVLNRVVDNFEIDNIVFEKINGKVRAIYRFNDKIFYAYIIYTHTKTFYYDFIIMNSKSNICFFLKDMKLYHSMNLIIFY